MSKSPKYYFSPPPTKRKTNEYVNNFVDALSEKVTIVNLNKKLHPRSLDYFTNSLNSDVMILNWPEDILHFRFGIFQIFASYLTFILYKLRGKKIIWICHNKDSHTKKYKGLRVLTRKFFTAIADKIIVHSEDALSFFINQKDKVHYLSHPVYDNPRMLDHTTSEYTIDVLIWGKICSYKGLNEFINNYKKFGCTFNVLMTGEADKAYLKLLNKTSKGTNITIKDEFITDEQLEEYFKNCKIILLPYLDSDTFSSGALIHSINSNKLIIGPRVGNFIDVQNYGACITYNSVEEMFSIVTKFINDSEAYNESLKTVKAGISSYYENNSWHNFIGNLIKIINE